MASYREELLAEAKRARRLEMRKASRIRREQGIEDLGKYGPRTPDHDRIKGYTNRQLEVYIEQSEQFRSRSQQFVKLGRDGVTTRDKWQRFDAIQQAQSRREREDFQQIKDQYLPSVGQTVGERHELLKPRFQRQMEGPPTGYGDPKTPEQLTSEDAMLKFQQRARKWASGELRKKRRDDFMKSVHGSQDVFDVFNDREIQDELANLTTAQMNTLLNIRDFAHYYFDVYDTYKTMDAQTPHTDAVKLEQQQVRASRSKQRVLGLIHDVKKIPTLGR